jgi:hypothetical protein
LKVAERDSSSSGVGVGTVPAIFASSVNVGPEEGDELEESGPGSSSSCGPWLALLLHALACTQASTRCALLLVVRDFLLRSLNISFFFFFFLLDEYWYLVSVCLLWKWKKKQEIWVPGTTIRSLGFISVLNMMPLFFCYSVFFFLFNLFTLFVGDQRYPFL